MADPRPDALLPPPPNVPRQDKTVIGRIVMGVVILGSVAGGYWWWNQQQIPQQQILREVREIPESDTTGTLPTIGDESRRKRGYGGVSLVKPHPAAAPPPETTPATTTVVQQTQVNPFQQRGPESFRPGRPAELDQRNGGQRHAVKTQSVSTAQSPKPEPNDWLFPKMTQDGGSAKPPFELTSEAKKRAQESKLFPQTAWEKPKRPERVIYQQQIIQGQLMHTVNTDIPDLVLIRVTEQVEDRWAQGEVLLPQYSVLIGHQEGQIAQGQSRIPIVVTRSELPDGSIMEFKRSQVGDQAGAAGVPGAVNNHWVQKGIAAVVTVMLSVGSRAVAGSPTGYNYTLGQEFARDGSQEINRLGRQAVDKYANIPPTIVTKYGAPVTIKLSEPINLQSDVVIVSR